MRNHVETCFSVYIRISLLPFVCLQYTIAAFVTNLPFRLDQPPIKTSFSLQACVNRMLSECAGLIEQKIKKAPARLCDSQPSLGSNDIISFRCHPDDASLFVICPPNTIIADIRRCPADRQFSLADKKCVDERTTDCDRKGGGGGGRV